MITTPYRGVGHNRNMALLYADAEILLFSDDDMLYSDGYAEHVEKAFAVFPKADVIVFEVDLIKNGEVFAKCRHNFGRLPLSRSGKYGTYAIAIRKNAVEKANIKFHQQFGGGCIYSAGEDSLFLRDCYRKGL